MTACCTINLILSYNMRNQAHILMKIAYKYFVYTWCRDDFMTIATTRPETLFGDVAIAVNPEVRVLQCCAVMFSYILLL